MTQPYRPPPGDPGERWNVNMPAVIGVVFVFLLGVVIWVISSSRDDPGDAAPPTTTGVETDPTRATAPADTTIPPTTTPPTAAPTTAAPPTATSAPPVTSGAPDTAPPTTATGAPPGAVPGDLGIPGRPMQQPGCDGAFITILASAIGDQATPGAIAGVLDAYPGSSYLRTDQTCPSLTPDIDGQPIYVVYLGPFAFDTDACAARAEGPDGAYARRLSNDLGPEHSVSCT